jgi:hypothetical protein
MTDAWILDLVAQVEAHENEHGDEAKGWKCHSAALEGVPAYIRHEAAGYAIGRRTAGRELVQQLAAELDRAGYGMRVRCQHYGQSQIGETLAEQREREAQIDRGDGCPECPPDDDINADPPTVDVLRAMLARVLDDRGRVDQAAALLLSVPRVA